jgi:23S rRNA (uracil1939-C5)-methyltransferase
MLTTGLEVEKLVYGGDGLSRDAGRVVLTPFVLAGERIDVEVEATKKGVARGKLVAVAEPSAGRVIPQCEYFGRCGGCHYQHASYEAQLEAKRNILRETLERVGKLKDLPGIELISAEPWSYRNRSQFHIENGKLGYRERGSHKLCAIERCPISSAKINECITSLNRMLRDRRWPKFIRSLEIFTNETEVQLNVIEYDQPVARRFFEWCADEIPNLVTGAIEYGIYRVSHGSFFQVNRFLVDAMVKTALAGAAGKAALDLYAGVGLFTLPLAAQFEKLTAVESGTGAIRDLEFNARRAGIQTESYAGNVDEYLLQKEDTWDFVLADPPRTGLGKTVTNRLNELRPPHIVIVSCDPATLARDLAALTNYHLDSLTLIDLFPQTFHIETIAKLSWRNSA